MEQPVGHGAETMLLDAHGARALAHDGDIFRVTAEGGDILPHPFQGSHLVIQAVVSGEARLLLQFRQG